MAILRPAVMLGLLLGAAPALAQSPVPGAAAVLGRVAGSARDRPPAASRPRARPSRPGGGTAVDREPQPVNEAEMIKAQKAAEARSKAWDSKMRHTMGSICHGC